jgi:NADPH2:quinone reductase
MRAVQATTFGGPEVLEMVDVPAPVPRAGQVLVAVTVAPVLYVDTQIRAGLAREWFPVTPPYVPGQGVAGRVVAVGEGTGASWVDRLVVASTTGSGGYLEETVLPAESLVGIPGGLGAAEAAALLHDGQTAVGLMEALSPRPGEWVLVTAAAGGMGALLVQLARQAGARVIAAAGARRKLELAGRLGAEQTVSYAEPDWASQVLAITDGAGPSVVFDGVGGRTGREAFGVTARGGRFSAHGTPGGGFAVIDPGQAAEREITVSGIAEVQFGPEKGRRLISRALTEAAAGRLHPVIGQRFPLAEAAEAHRAIEARAVIGKTLLEV